ncbi:MAG: hypothetical protein B6I37_07095 [Desulfobacteraceae bacterium 4572_35.2]|nr:MAG: hypothetical protein B6I37_07095 [Desulfobacteraceae bacterium 4572_35.2]
MPEVAILVLSKRGYRFLVKMSINNRPQQDNVQQISQKITNLAIKTTILMTIANKTSPFLR